MPLSRTPTTQWTRRPATTSSARPRTPAGSWRPSSPRSSRGPSTSCPTGGSLPEPGAHLDDRQRFVRVSRRGHRAHPGQGGGKTIAGAIDDYRCEAAFTFLNRFAVLKMLEARGLVQPCVEKGDQSSGFKEFIGLAPGLSARPDEGYPLYLECLFDELATEVNVLFDCRDPALVALATSSAALRPAGCPQSPRAGGSVGRGRGIGWVYQYFAASRNPARCATPRPPCAQPRAGRPQPVLHAPRCRGVLTDNTLGRIWYEIWQGRTALAEHSPFHRPPSQ